MNQQEAPQLHALVFLIVSYKMIMVQCQAHEDAIDMTDIDSKDRRVFGVYVKALEILEKCSAPYALTKYSSTWGFQRKTGL